MADFVPLARWLRGDVVAVAPAPLPPRPDTASYDGITTDANEPADDAPTEADVREAAAAARRFRAALAEAIDAAVARVVEAVAADVLARELLLAPADLAAIVRGAAAAVAPIVRVRVHPRDVARVRFADIAVVADAALRPGDAAIDVADGTYDLSLGARLGAVLAGFSA